MSNTQQGHYIITEDDALETYRRGASCTYLTDEEIAALPTPGDINATITTE